MTRSLQQCQFSTISQTYGIEVKEANVMKLETLQTTDQTFWKLHESYTNYHEAFQLIGFFKAQGYAAVKIKKETEQIFTIRVLVNRGE